MLARKVRIGMESTIIRRSTRVFLIILVLSLIPGAVDGEVGDIDLISISTEREIFHQNDRVIVDLKLNKSVDPFEIVLISNIDAWVMGIAPLSEQLPYTDLEIQVANELLDNGSYTLEFSLSDQMIWFDGLDMLDNVSITLAFLCMKNQTTDLEVISLKLIDVNEPPSIEGGISVSPEEIKVGEGVSFTISNITDPDMDEITISWEIDNEPAGSKKEIESIFKEPGTHAITVRASDGYMNDSRTRTIDVIAVKEADKDKPEESDDNETAPEPAVEQQEEGNLPWFLIPILLLMIIIVIILSMIRMIITAEDPPEKKEPPRKLWTMTPLRGPSRYEKAVIQEKLRALDNKNVVNMDEERVLEDDIERWELDWNFDPGF
jgi:hypothetical protein